VTGSWQSDAIPANREYQLREYVKIMSISTGVTPQNKQLLLEIKNGKDKKILTE
jgi:hypothetical protein